MAIAGACSGNAVFIVVRGIDGRAIENSPAINVDLRLIDELAWRRRWARRRRQAADGR